MKKVFISVFYVVLFFLSVSAAHSDSEKWKTDTFYNGRFILDNIENGNGSAQYSNAMYYCLGLIDAIKAIDINSKLVELYGKNASGNQIFEAICRYYHNNPSKQDKRVIEILLSGAK